MIAPVAGLPLVSIIITSYNRAAMIAKAIESALEQDYPNLEIVISDNASTDGTDEIIKKYTYDTRIRYSRNEENIGMLPNYRKATYELSRGEYLTYVSSDDYLTYKSFISDSVKLAAGNKNILLVFGKITGQNTQNGVLWKMPEDPFFVKTIWKGKDVFFKSVEAFLLSWAGCFMRRDAAVKVHTLMEDYYTADIDSAYKIMWEGDVAFLNEFCYLHLGHAGNHGFPVDARKIIQSMQCYENVASYALKKEPGEKSRIQQWRDHFIFFTINWAMYYLRGKSPSEFKLFKQLASQAYPVDYKKYINGIAYKKFLISTIAKKLIPDWLFRLIKKIRSSAFNSNTFVWKI